VTSSTVFDKLKISNLGVHLLLWVCYGVFLYFFLVNRLPPNRVHPELPARIFLFLVPQVLLVYFNMEYLVPRYFVEKKYWRYFLVVLLLLVLVYLLMDQIASYYWQEVEAVRERLNTEGGRQRRGRFRGALNFRDRFNPSQGIASINFILTLAILFLSTAIKTSQEILKREKESIQLRSENLGSNLKLLRSQINPHFLFNALNNIYSLALKNSPKTPDFILKLSEMMRYVIYEGNATKVRILRWIELPLPLKVIFNNMLLNRCCYCRS